MSFKYKERRKIPRFDRISFWIWKSCMSQTQTLMKWRGSLNWLQRIFLSSQTLSWVFNLKIFFPTLHNTRLLNQTQIVIILWKLKVKSSFYLLRTRMLEDILLSSLESHLMAKNIIRKYKSTLHTNKIRKNFLNLEGLKRRYWGYQGQALSISNSTRIWS